MIYRRKFDFTFGFAVKFMCVFLLLVTIVIDMSNNTFCRIRIEKKRKKFSVVVFHHNILT